MKEPDDINEQESAELDESDLERLAGGTTPPLSNHIVINTLKPH